MATFATGRRTPFARYWLSGFLADFAGRVRAATAGIRALMLAGAPPLAIAVAVLAWRHRGGRT